jgi:hypothetical protein
MATQASAESAGLPADLEVARILEDLAAAAKPQELPLEILGELPLERRPLLRVDKRRV